MAKNKSLIYISIQTYFPKGDFKWRIMPMLQFFLNSQLFNWEITIHKAL